MDTCPATVTVRACVLSAVCALPIVGSEATQDHLWASLSLSSLPTVARKPFIHRAASALAHSRTHHRNQPARRTKNTKAGRQPTTLARPWALATLSLLSAPYNAARSHCIKRLCRAAALQICRALLPSPARATSIPSMRARLVCVCSSQKAGENSASASLPNHRNCTPLRAPFPADGPVPHPASGICRQAHGNRRQADLSASTIASWECVCSCCNGSTGGSGGRSLRSLFIPEPSVRPVLSAVLWNVWNPASQFPGNGTAACVPAGYLRPASCVLRACFVGHGRF